MAQRSTKHLALRAVGASLFWIVEIGTVPMRMRCLALILSVLVATPTLAVAQTIAQQGDGASILSDPAATVDAETRNGAAEADESNAGDPRGPYADALIASGARMDGWWGILNDEGPTEKRDGDGSAPAPSRNVMAINVSLMTDPDAEDAAALMAICSQDEIYFIWTLRRLAPSDVAANDEDAVGSNGAPAGSNEPSDASEWVAARRAGVLRLVRLSLDATSARAETWIALRNGSGAFTHGEDARALLQQAQNASALALEMDAADRRITSRFALEGVSTAAWSIQEACPAAD